jgi:hypothetical protein
VPIARTMRPVSCPRATYQRHQPEHTVLYRTIAAHLPAFLARTAGEDERAGWPAFVRREFEAYLKCGILAHGFLRVRCERCGDTTDECPARRGSPPPTRQRLQLPGERTAARGLPTPDAFGAVAAALSSSTTQEKRRPQGPPFP